MGSTMITTARQEIHQIEMERAHVVILGAGASLAAFPDGDKYGIKLPLMNNLVETLLSDPQFHNRSIEKGRTRHF
jgi:hypothetical protein